jgi:hypothetical protein
MVIGFSEVTSYLPGIGNSPKKKNDLVKKSWAENIINIKSFYSDEPSFRHPSIPKNEITCRNDISTPSSSRHFKFDCFNTFVPYKKVRSSVSIKAKLLYKLPSKEKPKSPLSHHICQGKFCKAQKLFFQGPMRRISSKYIAIAKRFEESIERICVSGDSISNGSKQSSDETFLVCPACYEIYMLLSKTQKKYL